MKETRAAIEIRHNEKASRFEATVDGLLCFAAYDRQGGVLRMNHTSVPGQLEGRGIAAAIVRAAMAHAAAEGLRVEPRCSYVRAYMRRHPETLALLREGFRL
jgi:predicted GNAT family acetyltransferase